MMYDEYGRPRQDTSGGGGFELFGAVIGIGLLIVLLIFVLRVLAVSLLAALPISALLWVYTRLLAGPDEARYLTVLKTTFIGLFAYLAFTATTLIAVGAIHAAANTGAFAALVNEVFELRKTSLASLAILVDGRGDPAALLGLLGSGMPPGSHRLSAVIAAHGPGLFMFAFSLNRYIGRPYHGVVGMLIACGITLVTVLPCVGAIIWFLGTH
jgi:hypothetical protein